MDWADELARGSAIAGPQVVNDSKTPSGTVHVGSLRGPVVLDAIARALRERGVEARFLYGVDDLDPMDAQALLTPDAVDDRDGHAARPRARPGRRRARELRPPLTPGSSSTRSRASASIPMLLLDERHLPDGDIDPFIRTALDKAALVREIYRRVANVQHPDTWHPLGVICPTCGRVGTTIVTDWDGERSSTSAAPDLVTWATGCGIVGLDLAVRGRGQAAMEPRVGRPMVAVRRHDRAVRQGPLDGRWLARPLRRDRPRGLRARAAAQRAYEFLNIGGQKMSTSKGRGAAAHEIAEVVPPEQLRFLFLRPRPNHAIEFEPEGTDAIPRLFDEFDRFAAATAGVRSRARSRQFAATFRYSLLDPSRTWPRRRPHSGRRSPRRASRPGAGRRCRGRIEARRAARSSMRECDDAR